MRYAVLSLAASLFGSSFAFAQWEPDRTRIFSNIVIRADQKVESATCFFCSIRVDGELRGDAVAQWGDVEVSGKVDGDTVAVGGNVKLLDGAQVGGDMVSVFGDTRLGTNAHGGGEAVASVGYVFRSSGATVAKSIDPIPWPVVSLLPPRLRTVVALWLSGFALSVPLAFLSLAVFRRRRLEILTEGMKLRRWRTVLFGIVILAILVAGLQIGGGSNYADWVELPLCILIALVAAPGYAAMSLRVGSRYTQGSKLAILVGTLVLITLQSIPFLGWMLMPALTIFSIGSLVSSVKFRRKRTAAEEAAPAL